MLSTEGQKNRKLLKQIAYKMWKADIEILSEREINIPLDAIEIYMLIYGQYNILLEYETGTFALKIMLNGKYEYIDKYTDKKIIYGFDSLIENNIINNYKVLDLLLKNTKNN